MSLFTVVGVSADTQNQYKVRFANDLVSRVKILVKAGHKDIELMSLPTAMTKAEAVTYLKTTDVGKLPVFAEAISNADEKYNGTGKTVKVGKPALSIEAIKARNKLTS